MTTFLWNVRRLPPRLVASPARLQFAIAWANIAAQRRAATESALTRFTTALAPGDLDATTVDLRAEATVVRAVAEIFADSGGGRLRSCGRDDVRAEHPASAAACGRRKPCRMRGDLLLRVQRRAHSANGRRPTGRW